MNTLGKKDCSRIWSDYNKYTAESRGGGKNTQTPTSNRSEFYISPVSNNLEQTDDDPDRYLP